MSALNIFDINLQSVKNKKAGLCVLLESEKTDIVIGTQSWLTFGISNSEIFVNDQGYTPFREDRTTGIGGGVSILIKDTILSAEQKQYKTDCEIVRVTVSIVGVRPLLYCLLLQV